MKESQYPRTSSWTLPAMIVALSALSLGSCERESENAEAPNKVRMAYPGIVASLPMFVAEQGSLAEEHAIQIDRVEFQSSNDMVNALVSGDVDLLPAVSLIPIIHLEIQFPNRVRLFSHSRMSTDRAFDAVIIKKASSIKELSDLSGRKVGVFPGTSASKMFQAFLEKNGVDRDDITLVPLAPSAQVSSLTAGGIDALFSYEPITTAALKGTQFRTLFGSVYADLLDPCPIGCSVISTSFEKNNPDAARNAIACIDAAVAQVQESPAESKKLLTKFLGVSEDVATEVNCVDVTLSTELNIESLQAFINLLFEIGEIPEKIDASRLVRNDL